MRHVGDTAITLPWLTAPGFRQRIDCVLRCRFSGRRLVLQSAREPRQLAVDERLWHRDVRSDRARGRAGFAAALSAAGAKMAVLTTVMLLVVPLTAIRMISDYVCYRRASIARSGQLKGRRRRLVASPPTGRFARAIALSSQMRISRLNGVSVGTLALRCQCGRPSTSAATAEYPNRQSSRSARTATAGR